MAFQKFVKTTIQNWLFFNLPSPLHTHTYTNIYFNLSILAFRQSIGKNFIQFLVALVCVFANSATVVKNICKAKHALSHL